MDLEVHNLSTSEKPRYKGRVKSYQQDLANLEKDFRKSRIALSAKAREQLIGTEQQVLLQQWLQLSFLMFFHFSPILFQGRRVRAMIRPLKINARDFWTIPSAWKEAGKNWMSATESAWRRKKLETKYQVSRLFRLNEPIWANECLPRILFGPILYVFNNLALMHLESCQLMFIIIDAEDLSTQRETITRARDRIHDMDSNLGIL